MEVCERGWWCSRLTARHGNSRQWQFLKCHGRMPRLQRHVTHALSTPCFIAGPVPWTLQTVDEYECVVTRVTHLYSDIYWPEAATPIMLVAYLLLRWAWKRFAAVDIEPQPGLQKKSDTRVMRVGTGPLKTQHEPQPHHFSVFSVVTCCEALESISQANFDPFCSGKAEMDGHYFYPHKTNNKKI